MSIGQKGAVDRELRTLFQTGASGASTDGELIDQFVNGSERAFEELLATSWADWSFAFAGGHRQEHDAEDAFEAVFVVLSRPSPIALGARLDWSVARRTGSRIGWRSGNRRLRSRR